MNAVLTRTRASNCSIFSLHETTATPAAQDFFATTPMQALWREPDRQREEEAYTSFEAAISERVLALRARRLSMYTRTDTRPNVPARDRFVRTAFTLSRIIHSQLLSRLSLRLVGAAFMLMLVGFDLMGLLVLYAR